MSNESKREYIAFLRLRYQKANRKERSVILDEIERNFGIHRKSAVRLMLPNSKVTKRIRGRKPVYGMSTIAALRVLWQQMDYMCSKKIVAALPDWLPYFNADPGDKEKLLEMSAATMDRVLKPYRAALRRKQNAGTKPGRLLKNIIPVKPLDFNVTKPGALEADSVAHCGDSLTGEFSWSLTYTDILTGWTLNRAIWHKEKNEVVNATRIIEKKLPFEITSFSSDNGSEFLNYALLSYFADPSFRTHMIQMNRGRPYKKNDQCHVEQKNWTHVRQLFGYIRIDKIELIPLMNEIYDVWNVYQNFFIPQLKLIRKTRIGARYKREYSKPATPYERLLNCNDVSAESKEKIRAMRAELNPFELRGYLDRLLRTFMRRHASINSEDLAS